MKSLEALTVLNFYLISIFYAFKFIRFIFDLAKSLLPSLAETMAASMKLPPLGFFTFSLPLYLFNSISFFSIKFF